MRHLVLIAIVGMSMLVVAAPAFAGGGSVLTGHSSNPPAAQVLHTTKKPPKTQTNGTAPTGTPSTLPFTGLDLATAGILGFGLLGAGLMLRRSNRSER